MSTPTKETIVCFWAKYQGEIVLYASRITICLVRGLFWVRRTTVLVVSCIARIDSLANGFDRDLTLSYIAAGVVSFRSGWFPTHTVLPTLHHAPDPVICSRPAVAVLISYCCGLEVMIVLGIVGANIIPNGVRQVPSCTRSANLTRSLRTRARITT